MKPGIALIQLSRLDLGNFLPVCRKILGYSPAKAADTSGASMSEVAKELVCMAAFREEGSTAAVKDAQACLGVVHVGFLVAADDRDMAEILETAQGLNYVSTETLQRGVVASIVSGNLLLWRDAVRTACGSLRLSQPTREAYNEVYNILSRKGMKDIFQGAHVRAQPDNTFLLTDN